MRGRRTRGRGRKNRLAATDDEEDVFNPRKKRRLNQIGDISTKELRKNRSKRMRKKIAYKYLPILEDEDDTVFVKPEPADNDYTQFSQRRQKGQMSRAQRRRNAFGDDSSQDEYESGGASDEDADFATESEDVDSDDDYEDVDSEYESDMDYMSRKSRVKTSLRMTEEDFLIPAAQYEGKTQIFKRFDKIEEPVYERRYGRHDPERQEWGSTVIRYKHPTVFLGWYTTEKEAAELAKAYVDPSENEKVQEAFEKDLPPKRNGYAVLDGKWNSEPAYLGRVVINGNEGTYKNDEGNIFRIQRVANRTYTWYWKRKGAATRQNAGSRRGHARVSLSKDGNTFKGTWTSKDGKSGPWHATRVVANKKRSRAELVDQFQSFRQQKRKKAINALMNHADIFATIEQALSPAQLETLLKYDMDVAAEFSWSMRQGVVGRPDIVVSFQHGGSFRRVFPKSIQLEECPGEVTAVSQTEVLGKRRFWGLMTSSPTALTISWPGGPDQYKALASALVAVTDEKIAKLIFGYMRESTWTVLFDPKPASSDGNESDDGYLQ